MEEALRKGSRPFCGHDHLVVHRVRTDQKCPLLPDKQVTEYQLPRQGVSSLFPQAKPSLDIGGQDSKAITIDQNGRVTNFIMNDKCCAAAAPFCRRDWADTLGLKLNKWAIYRFKAPVRLRSANICTIWAQQEVASRLAEGTPVPDLIAGCTGLLQTGWPGW